jgi:chromosome segregation ATPase
MTRIRLQMISMLGALLIAGTVASARGAEDGQTAPASREQWRGRLLAANQAVASARQRSDTALTAYKQMRHRGKPRGAAKQAILDELAEARAELERASSELEQLEDAARRAGLTQTSLEFEPDELRAAAAPASESAP